MKSKNIFTMWPLNLKASRKIYSGLRKKLHKTSKINFELSKLRKSRKKKSYPENESILLI